jgi:Tfp pilus assembly protein FimT
MLVAIVFAAIMMKIAMPKLASLRDKNAVRSAKQLLGSYLMRARAASIRQSQISHFILASGGNIYVTIAQPNGTTASVTPTAPLASSRGVTVTSSGSATDQIDYDPRGIATGLASTKTFIITRNDVTDSLCVSRLGLIARYCGQ